MKLKKKSSGFVERLLTFLLWALMLGYLFIGIFWKRFYVEVMEGIGGLNDVEQ